MNILFTICARAGSKGAKNKNIRSFLNYPLVYHTLSAYDLFFKANINKYSHIHLAINTDSDILYKQCCEAKVPFIFISRTEELKGDKIAKADVISDTLGKVEKLSNIKYEIICDMDLTSPLRTLNDINGCIETLLHYPDAAVAYSVTHARRLPYFNMVQRNSDGFLETIIPTKYITRQECPECFDMNASLYAYRRNPLLATTSKDVFSQKCVGWLMKDTAILDIDSDEDFELLEVLANYFFLHYIDYGAIYNNIRFLVNDECTLDAEKV